MQQNKKSGSLFKYFGYEHNTALQLVFFIASCFILLHIVTIVFIILSNVPKEAFPATILPNSAIRDWQHFVDKPWTIGIYFLGHKSFFTLVGNMLWLYLFGNMVQSIIGKKEIIPLFFICSIGSGLVYIVCSRFMPSATFPYIQTSLPGVISMACAALTLSPAYRYRLTEQFHIPLWLFLLIFFVLSLVSSLNTLSVTWILYAASILSGFVYIRLIHSGIYPGNGIYSVVHRVNKAFTPAENPYKSYGWDTTPLKKALMKNNPDIRDSVLNALLDKIKKEGIEHLNEEEKKLLYGSGNVSR